MTPLTLCLLLSGGLFAIGLTGALTRRNAIVALIGIELMLNAANLNFIAFWRFGPNPNPEALSGIMVALFSIAIAAGEVAVGLAIVIAIYRRFRSPDLNQPDTLRG